MLIKAKNISKHFHKKCLYENVSVTINSGEKIAIVGENGSGKTTLLKILYGIEPVDNGYINSSIDTKIGYLSQLDINQCISVKEIFKNNFSYMQEIEEKLRKLEKSMENAFGNNMENLLEQYQKYLDMFEAYGGYELEKTYKEFISIFEIDKFINMKYSELSGGQKQYIRLCLILFGEYNLIFLDEPTSFLDSRKTLWLKNYVQKSSKAFLIVSHDVGFISQLCTKYFDIDNFRIDVYYGSYDTYIRSKHAHLTKQAQKNTTASNKIALLSDSICKQRKWMTTAEDKHKHKVLIDRLKRDLKKETEKIVHRQKTAFNFPITGQGDRSSSENKNVLIQLNNISVVLGEKLILSKISLTVCSGMHLIIYGENGVGKTTLLNIISQRIEPYSGTLYVDKKASLMYAEQGFIDDNITCADYFSSVTGLSKYQCKEHIDELFGLEADYGNMNLRLLSGGEKKRLQIGACVIRNPDIILLDEPTISLDEHSVSILFDMLKDYKGTIIVASHDTRFKEIEGFAVKSIDSHGNLI